MQGLRSLEKFHEIIFLPLLKCLTFNNAILLNFQSHKMAWPFQEPVDATDIPDYYEQIKEPMGMSFHQMFLQILKFNDVKSMLWVAFDWLDAGFKMFDSEVLTFWSAQAELSNRLFPFRDVSVSKKGFPDFFRLDYRINRET